MSEFRYDENGKPIIHLTPTEVEEYKKLGIFIKDVKRMYFVIVGREVFIDPFGAAQLLRDSWAYKPWIIDERHYTVTAIIWGILTRTGTGPAELVIENIINMAGLATKKDATEEQWKQIEGLVFDMCMIGSIMTFDKPMMEATQ